MTDGATIRLDFPFPEQQVFRDQAVDEILTLLVTNPFEQFTRSELATRTDNDAESVSKAVDQLKRLDLVYIEEGSPDRLGIDHDHIERPDPVSSIPQEEFRAPIEKFLEDVTSTISQSEEIEQLIGIVLFGTVASGSADPDDDIDLLVVVDGDLTKARRIVSLCAETYGNPMFEEDGYPFEVLVERPDINVTREAKVREIFEEGMVLSGSEELARVRTSLSN